MGVFPIQSIKSQVLDQDDVSSKYFFAHSTIYFYFSFFGSSLVAFDFQLQATILQFFYNFVEKKVILSKKASKNLVNTSVFFYKIENKNNIHFC